MGKSHPSFYHVVEEIQESNIERIIDVLKVVNLPQKRSEKPSIRIFASSASQAGMTITKRTTISDDTVALATL